MWAMASLVTNLLQLARKMDGNLTNYLADFIVLAP
jgi:hypothetical protein